jgi:hypothetical protein
VAAGTLALPLGAVGRALGPVPAPAPTAAATSVADVRVPAATACGSEPTTAAAWDRVLGRLDGDWAGADGSSSVRLPDGRLLWLFGDTLTGTVDAAGARHGATLVRNSLLLTRGTCVTSAAHGTDALPAPAGSWLWPTHAVVTRPGRPGETSDVLVLAQRLVRTGAGAFDFRRVATSAVPLVVAWDGGITVGRVRDVAGASVLWGAALVADGATTWVYGTRASSSLGRDLLLARAPTRRAGDRRSWTYRTADGWSRSAADAAVVRPGSAGVSTVPSAALVGGRVVLVTKPQEFLDDRVVELVGSRPWGPWTQRTLFSAPSLEGRPQYSPALVAGARPGHAIVVVNRTATSIADLMADASLSRPTFHDVVLLP